MNWAHFITLINDITIEEKDLLVTIDISSLYTNIIHKEGLEAMRSWILFSIIIALDHLQITPENQLL